MERSLKVNIAAGFFGMFWLAVPLGFPLPLLMQAVEATSTQLGILSASWQIAMLAQIPAAFVAESLPRRKPLWAFTSIPHRILWAAPALVPMLFPDSRMRWPALIITALSLSNLLANLGTASWQSWMADLVPETSAGSFWGVRHRFLALGLILATAAFGWILDQHAHSQTLIGFQWVFAVCALMGVCDILVHLWVREPPPARPAQTRSVFERIRAPFHSKGFRILTASMVFWSAAQSVLGYTIGMPGFFSMVHVKQTFGATFSQASLIFLSNALGALLFTPRLGRWMDTRGADAVLLRLLALIPLSQMGWWFAPRGEVLIGGSLWPRAILWMIPVSLVQGALLSGALLCQLRLTQRSTSPEGRTVSMAFHWSLTGCGGALGALGAGALQDAWPGLCDVLAPGLSARWTAFDMLVCMHALLTWFGALPLARIYARSRV